MTAYYNENDPFAVAWLRELIVRGVIENGEVDSRSIAEVTAEDLRGFTHCHFFAGIGVWAYALAQAGFPEDVECWTGSCPCQPFSVSGNRRGASDARHLWPRWFEIVGESRPRRIFGEQVASDDGLAWLDVVSADLENAGYTIGAVDTCAAGFGAPQISQRLFFVAEADGRDAGAAWIQRGGQHGQFAAHGGAGGRLESPARGRFGIDGCASGNAGHAAFADATGELESANESGCEGSEQHGACDARIDGAESHGATGESGGALGGFWRDAEWLWCRDGKYRPVEPGTFPLAHGAARRVGRLRGYGNALVAPQAIGFVRAYLEEKAADRKE